jgi:hypothetical protein
MTPTFSPFHVVRSFDANGHVGALLDRQPVHVGAQGDHLAPAACRAARRRRR